LSTAIGAYFAGFALSETESGTKIKKDVGFLRDFFLLFFFVSFGATLFFEPALNAVVLPSLEALLSIITLAVGLAIVALLAHSFVTRVFGAKFGLDAEDSSLSAILLFPLGEFVVIIATVAVVVFTGREQALLRPLAFLLILVTVMLFQPIYNFRALHQKIMSLIPKLPEQKKATVIKQHTPYTIKLVKEIGKNLFIILCLAWVAVLLYKTIPDLGVPVPYGRLAMTVALFLFFASAPIFLAARAFRRILKSLRIA
jgi:CPA2 family monovalent cation:H+ antiporter-2